MFYYCVQVWNWFVCIYLQNFPLKMSPYIIHQNKLQLFTLYSMNAPNWLSTLLFVISKAQLKRSMTQQFDIIL